MLSQRIQQQIDALLDEAFDALKRSEWDFVRQRADDILALDPENADARTLLEGATRRRGAPTPIQESPSPHPEVEGPLLPPPAGEGEGEGVPAPRTGAGGPPIPTSFVNGRYQVKQFLGEGAKKRVYLAHDSRLDRDVAFALIREPRRDRGLPGAAAG